jgi:transcriptional regulator with XRE-family HTH domain
LYKTPFKTRAREGNSLGIGFSADFLPERVADRAGDLCRCGNRAPPSILAVEARICSSGSPTPGGRFLPSRSRTARSGKPRPGSAKPRPATTKPEGGSDAVSDGGLSAALRRGFGAFSDGVRGRVAATPGVGLQVGRALLLSPEAARMRREAGRTVREFRELAGLTVDELTAALDLRDRSLLEAVEDGTATLSFELILRLSALLARNDPIPFVAQLARGSNPVLWKLLEDWGIGRIPLQMERERRFLNVFRGHDAARRLSDAGFERVLDYTRSAFEMALGFVAEGEGIPAQPSGHRKNSSSPVKRRGPARS